MVIAKRNNHIASKNFATPELRIIRSISESISEFPSTRYYGSKRKFLPWIYDHIKGLQFETALDAFGGTGSVSLLLAAMRKNTSYHDGLRFNEDVGRTLLSNTVAIKRDDLLFFLKQIVPHHGMISEIFADMYYTPDENAWLDGFLRHLDETVRTSKEISLLRYLLYQACLKKRPFNLFHRANYSLRKNIGIERSFGNFATWERSFSHHMLQAYDELASRPTMFVEPEILSSGNAERLSTNYDLVYIDPPYINLQERLNCDDYWRRYHFLEGLAQHWSAPREVVHQLG